MSGTVLGASSCITLFNYATTPVDSGVNRTREVQQLAQCHTASKHLRPHGVGRTHVTPVEDEMLGAFEYKWLLSGHQWHEQFWGGDESWLVDKVGGGPAGRPTFE